MLNNVIKSKIFRKVFVILEAKQAYVWLIPKKG